MFMWQGLLWVVTFINFLVLVILMYCNYKQGKDLPCWSGGGDEEYQKMERDKK